MFDNNYLVKKSIDTYNDFTDFNAYNYRAV